MPTDKNLTVTKINWTAVSDKVAKIIGKRLDPPYLRAVANGQRVNKSLKPVLDDILK